MYWLLLDMYSENLDLGQEVFMIRGTFINRRKGLYAYAHAHAYMYDHTFNCFQIRTDISV